MKCTKCGMEIPEDSVFCEECGAKLNSKEYRMGAGNAGDAIYCPFCGAGNPIDSVFCEECGKRLSGNAYTMNAGNADEVVYCPSCGADNPVDSMFCEVCGVKLDGKKHTIDKGNVGEAIYCPFCGEGNPVDSVFCEECGKKIAGDTSTLYCPSDHAKNPVDSMYCEESGRKIKKERTRVEKRIKLFLIAAAVLSMVVIIAVIGLKDRFITEEINNKQAELYIKSISDNDIVISQDTAYVDSQILVTLSKKASRKWLEKWIKKYDGSIVGEIPVSNTFQIEFADGKSQVELETIIKNLKEQDEIEMAVLNYASRWKIDNIDYIGEPWTATNGNNPEEAFEEKEVEWDSLYPDGSNWWAEAIWLSGVGNLDVESTEIKVGIIDTMFDTAHLDLQNAYEKVYQNPEHVDRMYREALLSEDETEKEQASSYAHGTHVSGLIGARVNNSGISGVSPNACLYGFSMNGTGDYKYYTSLIEFEYAFATLLHDEVRVINMSMGADLDTVITHMLKTKRKKQPLTEDERDFLQHNESQREFLEIFFRRCEEQYDFLFFKATGNEQKKKIVRASEEDEHNENIETCAGYRFYNSLTDQSLEYEEITGVSCKDDYFYINDDAVRRNILYIGAMERMNNKGKFARTDFSCIDEDLLCPGRDVLSDLPDGEIGYMSGTSMATPIAAGTAAMVWSVNPSLTASQVRSILLNSQRPFTAVRDNKTIVSEPMLNSYYAVSAAIEAIDNPIMDTESEHPKQEYAILMGSLYEETEGSPSVDLENAQDIIVTVTDDKELYQIGSENMESGGGFVFFIKPGTYRMFVSSSYYEPCEIKDIIVEAGDVLFKSIGLERKPETMVVAIDETQQDDTVEKYIDFIRSQTDALDYLVYDIDKDGYPELFIEKEHTGTELVTGREYYHDIYTYKNGEFQLLDTWTGSGYNGQDLDVYASFPNENGILTHAVVWGSESLMLYRLVDGKFESEVIYSVTEDTSVRYYLEEDDQVYKDSRFHNAYINHQYYKGETSSPYCEGSYLLAQSAPDNFSAVYEAFNDDYFREIQSTADEVTIDTLKSYLGKNMNEVPYNTTPQMWGRRSCYETTDNVGMYGYLGKILFETEDDLIKDVFWTCDTIRFDEIEQMINNIRNVLGQENKEFDEDTLHWVDVSDGAHYYFMSHEVPIIIGVKRLSESRDEKASGYQNTRNYG